MQPDFKFVVQDKNKNVINVTPFNGDFKMAKNILGVLMYQTGVRYGYILQKKKVLFHEYFEKVYDDVIVHEGE